MKVLLILTLILIIIFILSAIYTRNTHWTEKQRIEFAEKCSNTDTANGLSFSFTGFRYAEIKNVIVQQVHNGKIVDSFYVHPQEQTFDSLRTRYFASTYKHLYIKDSFQFIVKGYKAFVLCDMKMTMWSQFSMYSEGYDCVMGDYKINGVRFEHNANPDFIKTGFKFSWEK